MENKLREILIGKKVSEITSEIEGRGLNFRIMEINGEPLAGIQDLVYSRVNLHVTIPNEFSDSAHNHIDEAMQCGTVTDFSMG